MTAALLSRLFTSGYTITLIEASDIGTIGVGEATILAIKIFNEMAGIDDLDLLREAHATYKLGIEFVNWREPGHSYIRSEEHTSELQSLMRISYAVFCLQ